MASVVGEQAALHRLLRGVLQAGVQRRVDDDAGVDFVAELLEDLPAHPLRRIGRGQVDAGAEHLRGDRRSHRFLIRHVVDGVLGQHPPQHQIAPFEGPFGAVDGVAAFRLLDDAGQHRVLRESQLIDRLAVVGLRRRLHPVGALAEGHDVHVELQDLLLGELLLDLQRQQHLLEFADELLLVAERDDLRQLHRERTRAGAHVGGEQAQNVVRQGHEVDSAVRVEALVLGADQAVEKLLRHVFKGDGNEAVAEFRDQRVVRRIDPQRRFQAVMSVGVGGRNLRVQVEKN